MCLAKLLTVEAVQARPRAAMSPGTLRRPSLSGQKPEGGRHMGSSLGGSSGSSLDPIPDQLLLDFLDGVSYAAEEFVRVARPLLLALARRRAPDLPFDLRRDIVSE